MSPTTTTLVLVRHGETAWNAEGRVQGQTDVPLNDVGRAQAEALVPVLGAERFDAMYSSDLLRVRETAQPTARVLGLDAALDAGLRERHYGQFETLTYVECAERFPAEFERFRAKELDFDFGTGESLQAFNARSMACVRAIAERHRPRRCWSSPTAVCLKCCYARPLRAGCARRATSRFRTRQSTASSYAAGRWTLRTWAERAHLDAALDDLRD